MHTETFSKFVPPSTPLLELRNIEKMWDVAHLVAKLEYATPSKNHKYRYAQTAVNRFRSGSWPGISAASCGHLARSLAILCAEHQIPCQLFVPRGCPVSIPSSPFVITDFRAASYDAAVQTSLEFATSEGLLEATPGSQLAAEYRDSLACISTEILACGPAPDAVVCPVGNGTTLAGIHHGFLRADAPAPRHYGVGIAQNPLTGVSSPADVIDWDLEPLHSIRPLDEPTVRHAVYTSGGAFVCVSPEELYRARDLLWHREGLRLHPSAAAPLAGWKVMLDRDPSLRAERVVLVLTALVEDGA